MIRCFVGLEVEVYTGRDRTHKRIELGSLTVDFRIETIPGLGECEYVLRTYIKFRTANARLLEEGS